MQFLRTSVHRLWRALDDFDQRQALVFDSGRHSDHHQCRLPGTRCSRRARAAWSSADVLAVQRMLDPALDQHGDGLVHLVADTRPVSVRCFSRSLMTPHLAFCSRSGHVLTRAMSRRTLKQGAAAQLPVPFCMRRLNCSRSSSSSSSLQLFVALLAPQIFRFHHITVRFTNVV
jgi:hypothetical protein